MKNGVLCIRRLCVRFMYDASSVGLILFGPVKTCHSIAALDEKLALQ
jgi:hypothetical protein